MDRAGHRCVGVGGGARQARRATRAVAGMRSCCRRPLRTYLVVFDGDDWADVVAMRARSVTDIAAGYPEATVLEHRPVWMSAQEYDRLRREARGASRSSDGAGRVTTRAAADARSPQC